VDDAVRFEVRGRALQAVRGAPQRLAVALFDRFANLFEMTGRVVDEQLADLGEQLTVAADASQDVIGDFCAAAAESGFSRWLSRGHLFDERAQPSRVERLSSGIRPFRPRGTARDRLSSQCAVIAMIGTCAPVARSRSRMTPVASNPPISGICTSISTTSNDPGGQRVERFAAVVGNGHLVPRRSSSVRREPLVDRVVLGQQQAATAAPGDRSPASMPAGRRGDRRRGTARARWPSSRSRWSTGFVR
jgi:hypothetical protein